MSNNVAPDSWDNDVENDPEDPSSQFSTLNVNAMEFVPFIPKSNAESDEKSSPSSDSTSENKLSVTNGKENNQFPYQSRLVSTIELGYAAVLHFILQVPRYIIFHFSISSKYLGVNKDLQI